MFYSTVGKPKYSYNLSEMSLLCSLEKLGAFGVPKQILLRSGTKVFGTQKTGRIVFPSYEINECEVVLAPTGITYRTNFIKISIF